jgi:hypothetical protein
LTSARVVADIAAKPGAETPTTTGSAPARRMTLGRDRDRLGVRELRRLAQLPQHGDAPGAAAGVEIDQPVD